MAYKNDLQLAFSGKEIASQRIAIIEQSVFENESAEQFSIRRREKYQRLLDQSDAKILDIKSRVAEEISVKKFQLEGFKNERTQVNTRYQLREISFEERERIENGLHKKFDKVKAEAAALQQLYNASSSSEVGGQIPIDVDKDVDDYGNIIKKPVINIPNNIKMPSADTFSNIKVPSTDTFSNLSNGISTQGLAPSHANLISLIGAIGGIIAIFLPWIADLQNAYALTDFSLLIKQVSAFVSLFSSIFDVYGSNSYTGLPVYLSIMGTYWFILLCVLLVCIFLIISRKGQEIRIGIGFIVLLVIAVYYALFLEMYANLAVVLGSGFYIEIICMMLLIIGGVYELKES